MALEAIKKNGPVKLLDVSEIRDDDYFCPAAIMGAPAVMMEKIPLRVMSSNGFSKC